MRAGLFFATLLCFFTLSAWAINVGTDKNFHAEIWGGTTLVVFYSPSCPHCQKFLPIFEEACEQIEREKFTTCVKVDITQNRKVADKYHIRGVPTIMRFEKSTKIAEFTRQRTVDNLIDFMGQ